ncbi:IS66 family insertion sequence element accessory protein TnpB [Pseudomonas sp. 24 E 13]|uniref:IS66 family insertion sequence element accessory protein TnpB n=1 Tax=Pseudomonas sp. 24 E 13 TaxID=1844095 RepID=UPI00351EF7B1
MDMRAGTETALARVIAVFGAARPHCAYLFANRRATRMKVLVHGHTALDTGAVGGSNRRAAPALGRCAARSGAGSARGSRR